MSDAATTPPHPLHARAATTTVAGEAVDQSKGRIFPCEQCGADLEFHIGQQRLKCGYCGFERDVLTAPGVEIVEQDFRAMIERLAEQRRGGSVESLESTFEITCASCSGTVVFHGPLTSTHCAFCGSPIQREGVHAATSGSRRIAVDAVLPFKIEERQARANLEAWVRSRWFAPNDFTRHGVNGRFSGVYLPYWTFDCMTFTRYTGERGEHYYVTTGTGKNRRRERRTRWYPASGAFSRFFDDVLVCAGSGLPQKMIISLEPWPLHRCLPFTQEVIAGHLARTYEVELDRGFVEARQRIDEAIRADVCGRIGGDEQRIHSIHSTYDPITFKHILLPLWLMSYRYRDRVYRVVINAGTGEVQGERPWSWVKIALAVLAAMILGSLIGLFVAR